ncbi:hypothetical protein LCGC14_0862950 [marine sediment metagenome]|uniref:Uncharacterized protein n=1 Tax=marine sediment metagenome TaxID=412755 RepID=A0A0F9SDZ2_9ZZZZ
MKKELKLSEKLNPLVYMLDMLLMVSIGVTSMVCVILVIKYIFEIFALNYISNIDGIKYVFRIIGFISFALITLFLMDRWYKQNPLNVRRELDGTIWGWICFIIFIVILFFLGWSIKIFVDVT